MERRGVSFSTRTWHALRWADNSAGLVTSPTMWRAAGKTIARL